MDGVRGIERSMQRFPVSTSARSAQTFELKDLPPQDEPKEKAMRPLQPLFSARCKRPLLRKALVVLGTGAAQFNRAATEPVLAESHATA